MAMAMTLRLRPASSCSQPSPHLFSFFSSSSSSNDGENEENPSPPPPPPSSSSSSYFKDVKASLRQSPIPIPNRRVFSPSQPQTPPPSPKPSKIASLEEIRKNLSEFRRKSAAPPTHPHPHPPSISFQELYKSNVIDKTTTTTTDPKSSRNLSFEAIRENLRQLRSTSSTMKQQRSKGPETLNPLSLQVLKESLKLKPPSPPPEMGTSILGPSIFRRETEMDLQPSLKTEFVRMYSYGELGEKLKKLRPPAEVTAGKKDWFSLGELNERLRKLREMEEKEAESRIGGVSFKDLRESLVKLQKSSDVSAKKSSGLAMLGQLGGQVTPRFMLSPPKDNLVEKYFHPDNMSSAEKLKLELKAVRDEFKMSESDCGSSRVQVAQLTKKIKHLSSVLHKKDKHSRKGLQEMVQRRKKLLKYLRRTDWDSYCFVLSKLGLRDNPDYKN